MSKILENYMNKLFNKEEVQEQGGIVALMSITSLVGTALQLYQTFVTKKEGFCDNREGLEKSICLLDIKIEATKVYLGQLKSNINSCSKTNDPDKCKEKIGEKIKIISDRLTALERKSYEYKRQLRGA